MQKQTFEWNDISTVAQLSIFNCADVAEYHATVKLSNCLLDAQQQFASIETALTRIAENYRNITLIFKRYFVSDAVNQAEFLTDSSCAVSFVEQSPVNGTKVAVWAYFVDNCKIFRDSAGTFVMQRPYYKHLYNMQMTASASSEARETRIVFENYVKALAVQNCSLADNCIRTWIFVQGIDLHYAGMVEERKLFFAEQGLTPKTHFIASTGIEGSHIDCKTLVFMDAYAIAGIRPEQISFINAPENLNPTYEYGVTFERATSVDYGDRRHIFVAGTASINNKGEIVHRQDLMKQTDRVFENIAALLAQKESEMNDVAQMTVYLRDIADGARVEQYFKTHGIDIPYLIVHAPVCRPGWLVEIECIAIKEVKNSAFENF
ncbi:MAG: hypothetical protein LBD59_07865 [Prevotellaceae bacterium]|jgi:enamine deaminase RidA (YjgF/YER057c/UK114 family)|nr:hypothetical protein [Prevotellaceae bacterium]